MVREATGTDRGVAVRAVGPVEALDAAGPVVVKAPAVVRVVAPTEMARDAAVRAVVAPVVAVVVSPVAEAQDCRPEFPPKS